MVVAKGDEPLPCLFQGAKDGLDLEEITIDIDVFDYLLVGRSSSAA